MCSGCNSVLYLRADVAIYLTWPRSPELLICPMKVDDGEERKGDGQGFCGKIQSPSFVRLALNPAGYGEAQAPFPGPIPTSINGP